jgi:hypothetical protein
MKTMKEQFPPGWNEERVSRVLAHYENQTDEEALAEDEAVFKSKERTVVEVPVELMPVIREVLAQYRAAVAH